MKIATALYLAAPGALLASCSQEGPSRNPSAEEAVKIVGEPIRCIG